MEFQSGESASNSLLFEFVITDDDVALEDTEMYTASFKIISSVGNVIRGSPDTTVINVIDDDSKQNSLHLWCTRACYY